MGVKTMKEDGETLTRLNWVVWCRNCDYEVAVWRREGERKEEAIDRAVSRHESEEPDHAVRCDPARNFS